MNPPARPKALPVARIRPAYVQIAGHIRDLIVRGVLVPGQRLPSEERLGENFGVSRNTVREALRSWGLQQRPRPRRAQAVSRHIQSPAEEERSRRQR